MNAVVSGQAGVALLVNGSELASIHAGRSGEIVRRSPAEARFLLGDAGDLQFLEDVEVDEVIRRLELASAQMDAFHTALILLDGSLPPETRQIAAEELQEFFGDETLSHFVESVLFAHPLTRDSDLPGALALCTDQTGQIRDFLHRLASLQGVIAEVYLAWEGIATQVFGNEENRNTARALAVRAGLFRELVLCQSVHASMDQFLVAARQVRLRLNNRSGILLTWVASLREVQPAPRPNYPVYERESQFLGEATRQDPEEAAARIRGVYSREERHNQEDKRVRLSPREQEVMRLAAGGMSDEKIASRLGCAQVTVRTHRMNIYRKLGLKSRGEAAAWAWSHGDMDDKDGDAQVVRGSAGCLGNRQTGKLPSKP